MSADSASPSPSVDTTSSSTPGLLHSAGGVLFPATDCTSLPQAGGPPAKRKRADLTPKLKKEICLYKESNPTLTQNSVCLYAENALGVRIGRSTVCDILKDKEKWIALGDIAVSTRIRRPKHEELENALSTWYAEVTAGEGPVTVSDDLLRDQAKLLGKQLGIEDFQYSNGWLSRFKARRGLHLARMERAARQSGASGDEGPSAPTHPDYQKEVNQLLAAYSPDNVYYCEAMDLAYRMEWHANHWRDSVALLLCSNVTGFDRRPPLVVWRRQRARCFGQAFDPNQLCCWRANDLAKLTPLLFAEWLAEFDADCQRAGRRILLLCHVPSDVLLTDPRAANVTLCLLSAWQVGGPFRGIQEHFRCLMGFQQLARLLEEMEEEAWPPTTDVKQALYCLRDAWAEFRIEVVVDCLQAWGLNVAERRLPADQSSFEAKFNALIGHAPDELATTLPLQSTQEPPPSMEYLDDSEAPAVVSPDMARKAIDSLTLFMEQHLGDGANQFSVHDLDCLRNVRRRCMALKREEMRQGKLASCALRPTIKVEEYSDIMAPELDKSAN